LNNQFGASSPEIEQAAAGLIEAAGWEGDCRVHPLRGGANNRVFRVEVDESSALLKSYFYHPNDPRDRLGAEFGFTSFAWQQGLRCLPRPYASDPVRRLGLYEFLQGRRLVAAEINEDVVDQAIEFYQELNRFRHAPEARKLPMASEASFTIADHLARVETRMELLRSAEQPSSIDQAAALFIRNELNSVWRTVASEVRRYCDESDLSMEAEIPLEDRRLSPSDFGFHNAILVDDRLRFIDFEYAGWDDPAKSVCDFFCQPEVPVPLKYFPRFLSRITEDLSDPQSHAARVALLLPVYQIKWCCILLNDFLPVDSTRRRFAGSGLDLALQKSNQLDKARRALKAVLDEKVSDQIT
jgi:hypothetical protein